MTKIILENVIYSGVANKDKLLLLRPTLQGTSLNYFENFGIWFSDMLFLLVLKQNL